MDLILNIDTQNRRLVSGAQNSQPYTLPPLMQGDTVRLVLNGVKPNPTPTSAAPFVPDPIIFTGIKAGIGPGPDSAPTAGSYRLRLQGGADFTPQIAFNASQQAVSDALNALASVTALGGVRFDSLNVKGTNFFVIRWVNPAVTTQVQLFENLLEPYCFVRSYTYTLGAGQSQVLKFFVAPVAFTDAFAYPVPDPVTVESVRVGTSAKNCIQSVTIPATAVGSFTLKRAGVDTAILLVPTFNGKTDASAALATALNGIYSDSMVRFKVALLVPGKYTVEFVGPLEKADWPLLDVTMFDQVPVQTPVALMPLNGPAMELALFGQPKITQTFEIEITSTTGVVTPVQVPVTILNDMIDAPMDVHADPSWLLPLGPEYPPYDPQGATITAPKAYVTQIGSAIGNGSSFVVTHNLGSLDVLVAVRQTGGDRLRLPDGQYVCAIINDSQVRLDFYSAPPDGTLEVMVAAIIPAALALPYHTHTIAQVQGLQDALDELTNGINPDAPIDASRLPALIPWYGNDGTTPRFNKIPASFLPDDVALLDDDGKITNDMLPVGVPHAASDGSTIIDQPTPTDGSVAPKPVVLLDATNHIPVELLPVDPSGWQGLATALLKALQSGATLKSAIIIRIDDYAESFPPLFVIASNCAGDATPAYSTGPTTTPGTITPGTYTPGYTIPGSTTTTPPSTTTNPGSTTTTPPQVVAPVYTPGTQTNPTVQTPTTVAAQPAAGDIRIPASIMPALFNVPLAGPLPSQVVGTSTGLGAPSDASNANKRFTLDIAGASSMTDVYRVAQSFKKGMTIVSNSFHWYEADVIGSVCYPKEYNRELFAFYVSADMLVPNTRFAVDFTLQAQFTSPNDLKAEYTLTIEIGTPQGSTGAGIGDNISGVNWYGVVTSERIILSKDTVYHHFGYAVARDPAGVMTAVRSLYASFDLPAAVPQGPGFMVRARLSRFDIEDDPNLPNPTGQINLVMLNSTASIVKANATS